MEIRHQGLLGTRWLTLSVLVFSAFVCVAQSGGSAQDPVIQREKEIAMTGDVLAKCRANDHCLYLDLPRPFSNEELLPELEKLAATGAPEAVYRLGVVKYAFDGTKAEGRTLLQKAAEQGSAKAQNYWAYICLKEKKDAASAEEWWRKAHLSFARDASGGDLDAMYALGMAAPPAEIKDAPDFPPLPKDEAMRWLERAAAAGHLAASYRLAKIYGEDSATKAQQEDSWKYYLVAVNAGYRKALVEAGLLYEFGFSNWKPSFLKKNHAKAWDVWDQAVAIMGESDFYAALPLSREELPPRPKK